MIQMAHPGSMFALEDVSRLVQLSLTPVFLLSALASLLGVFSTRLGRVHDRVELIAAQLETAAAERRERLLDEQAFNRRRTHWLDIAVVLAALGGTLTCASALTLFLGSLTGFRIAAPLFLLFGGAILAAIGALVAFGYEMLLASQGVRRKTEGAPPAA